MKMKKHTLQMELLTFVYLIAGAFLDIVKAIKRFKPTAKNWPKPQ